jgi:hypothetical protein
MTANARVDVPASDDVIELAGEWLDLPAVGALLDMDPLRVRQLLRDRELIGLRTGERGVLRIPSALLPEGAPVKGLAGLLTVLADAGFDENEMVRWLFTADDTLPGTPVAALVERRGTEVKRRAQALAF